MTVVVNRATKGTFSGLKILFQVSKIRKKGYMEMTEKFYLETLNKCPRYLYLPLLTVVTINQEFIICIFLNPAFKLGIYKPPI